MPQENYLLSYRFSILGYWGELSEGRQRKLSQLQKECFSTTLSTCRIFPSPWSYFAADTLNHALPSKFLHAWFVIRAVHTQSIHVIIQGLVLKLRWWLWKGGRRGYLRGMEKRI